MNTKLVTIAIASILALSLIGGALAQTSLEEVRSESLDLNSSEGVTIDAEVVAVDTSDPTTANNTTVELGLAHQTESETYAEAIVVNDSELTDNNGSVFVSESFTVETGGTFNATIAATNSTHINETFVETEPASGAIIGLDGSDTSRVILGALVVGVAALWYRESDYEL